MTAFTTTLSDEYVPGFFFTFGSLLNSTLNFNFDLIIFEWGCLSKQNKDLITAFYPNVYFKKIKQEDYGIQTHDTTWRNWTYNCNYRFDIFTLTEYQQVIFFDSDILFEIDASELVSYNVDFGACIMPYNFNYNQTIAKESFNAGLMIIGKKYLNKKVKEDLINISNSLPPPCKDIKSNKWFGNQPILNNYFYEKMTKLPEKFNFLTDRLSLKCFKEPKNFHFIGHKKPWNVGNLLVDKFDKYIFDSISDNQVIQTMVLKKINERCILQIERLNNTYKFVDKNNSK